jgi:hypothetical protein
MPGEKDVRTVASLIRPGIIEFSMKASLSATHVPPILCPLPSGNMIYSDTLE